MYGDECYLHVSHADRRLPSTHEDKSLAFIV